MNNKNVLAAALILCDDLDCDIEMSATEASKVREKCSELYKRRESEGTYNLLVTKHLIDSEVKFKEYFRFTREQFSYLTNLIKEDCLVDPTNSVKITMSPEMKLAVTLRFLATGESFRSIAFIYRISHSAISTFVPKVLLSLKNKLQDIFLPPASQIDWGQKAQEFWCRWQFPNCLAGIDGKHVRIICPDNSGSLFHNFKGFFLLSYLQWLMQIVNFYLSMSVPMEKKEMQESFKKSELGQMVSKGKIFPPPQDLPGSNIKLPHVIVGDEAFRLDKHVMKPFTQKQAMSDTLKANYYYAMCIARRVTESAFGLMSVAFRIFFTPINLKPETVDLVIFVSCCLHNMLRNEFISKNPQAHPLIQVDEVPTQNMIPLAGTGWFAKAEGFKVRSRLVEYLNSVDYKNHVKKFQKDNK